VYLSESKSAAEFYPLDSTGDETLIEIVVPHDVLAKAKKGTGDSGVEYQFETNGYFPVTTKQQLTDIWNKAQEGKKVQPTVDNLKPSKQAERIQDKAVADKLGIVFDNISQYEAKNNKEELAKANEIIQNDYEKAKNIALGYENAPEGVMDNAVFIAVRNKAEKSNDVELMLKLAQQNSRVEQTSKFGQEVQILSQIEEDNPISAIQDVAKTKASNYEKRTKKDVKKEKKDNIKAIKESVKKEVMDGVKTWDDFLTELEC